MSILRDVSGVSTSDPGYYYTPSINNSGGITDQVVGTSSNSSYSNETLSYSQTDDSGGTIAGPLILGFHQIPPTDPNTGVIFDNQYNAFQLSEAIHGVFYTQSTSSNYNASDSTSLKLQEFDDSGDFIRGPKSLQLGGRAGVKDLYQVSEGSGADFGNSFVVAYSTYNPEAGTAQIRYEQFDDAGNPLNGGVLRSFDDGTHHGLNFGTFYSSSNPNAEGSPDYLLQNRVAGGNSGVQVELESPDMQNTMASTVIRDHGPNGQAPTSIDKFSYLRPGSGENDNFGVLSQTFQYKDANGQTHEEIALEKVNPVTLQVEARTEFADVSGSQSGVGLQHLSNGNVLAIYNDGGQSYIKEFNHSLQQVGQALALPRDNDGWDSFVSLGNNEFQVDWRQHTTASSSSPTVEHSAIFKA